MTNDRDTAHRDLIEAEAIHAHLIATATGSPATERAFARWIQETEQQVVKLRERVARLDA